MRFRTTLSIVAPVVLALGLAACGGGDGSAGGSGGTAAEATNCTNKIVHDFLLALIAINILFIFLMGNKSNLDQNTWHPRGL